MINSISSSNINKKSGLYVEYKYQSEINTFDHYLFLLIFWNCEIVLEQGEIVESGNHQELIKNDGFYKKLSNA